MHKDKFKSFVPDISMLPKLMSDLECCGNCGNRHICPDTENVDGVCDRWEWDMLKKQDREDISDV